MKHSKATDLLQRGCRFFSVFRHTCADAVSAAPAIAALAAVLVLLLFRYCAGYSIPVATLAVFLTVIFLLPLKTVGRYILLFLAAAVISLYLHEPDADPLEPYRIDRRFSGDFVVRITDPAVDPALTAERMVRCGILKFRPAGEENWIALTEPVSTGVTSLAHGVGYGDEIRFSALLHEVEPPRFPDVFDYRAYLKREGIHFLLRRDQDTGLELCDPGRGFFRTLYDWRNRVLARMTATMKSEDAKALTAGILFGITRDLEPETKQDFLRSGMIHILTVSGTHVGIFSLIILLCCFPLSFRWKAFAVLGLTAFYVLLTGASDPSIRALVMIACFLLAKVFRFRTKSINTLAFAALFLLICDPPVIFTAGFQFSFLIVAVLILSAPVIPAMRRTLFPEQFLVLASRIKPWRFYLSTKLRLAAGIVLASILAAVTGAALSVCFQGLLSTSSVIANLLLMPFLFLLFPVAFAAAIFSGVCSRILENLLLLILRVNRCMAESGVLTVADPPLWSVILMIAAVFILFLPKHGWWKIPVACGIILLPLYWHLRTIQAEPELLVLYGADDSDLRKISFVLTEPARRSSVILNLPDWSSAADADTFLKSRGIRKCRLFLAADHYAGSVAGADPFSERAELTEAVLFSRQMGKCTGDYPRKERKDGFFSGKDLKIQSERGNFNAVFPEYGITLDVQRQKDGLLILRINGEEWRIAPTLQRHFRIFRIGKNRIETIQER